jgi:hypothetical protein
VEGKQVLLEEQVAFRLYTGAGRDVVRLRCLEGIVVGCKREVERSKILFRREFQNQLRKH